MQRLPASCAVLLVAGFAAGTARAQDGPVPDIAIVLDHASVGYLAHDVAGLWSGFRIERAATAVNLDIVFAPHVDLLWGTVRPALGGTIANGEGTSYGYADARYEIAGPFRTFFGVGLGIAVHDGMLTPTHPLPPDGHDGKALGSRALFHVPIEIGVAVGPRLRLSAYFEHVSNGWIGTNVNEGLDNIGARVGYRF